MEGDSNSYPKPSSFLIFNERTPPPRDLLPIYPPPEPLVRPELPTTPRAAPSFDAPYRLSTHIVPSTYLRTTWAAPLPSVVEKMAGATTKQEKNDLLASTFQSLAEGIGSVSDGISDGHPRVLWNCLNRYVKKGLNDTSTTRMGITLFLAHANGFPKETWEPILAHLLSSQAANLIDEVWAWEAVQHGDAALINASSATGIFDWTDNARDIVNFLLHFLPNIPIDTHLPTYLSRVSPKETKARLKLGFSSHRQIVVVGHSFGGCSSALAACIYPALFTSLILVDPVIVEPTGLTQRHKAERLAISALGRREQWLSRSEALESFTANPFFRIWDPDMLLNYVQHGTYETTDSKTGQSVIRLKTAASQEYIVFINGVPTCIETFDRMKDLDERIALRWIVPGRPEDTIGGPGDTARRVWVRMANATNVKLNAGHLIPMEVPKELAQDIEQYLLKLFSSTNRRYFKSNM